MYTDQKRADREKNMAKMMILTDRLHRKECEKRFASLNIHRSQHMMLMTLARLGDGISQKDLAREMHISTAAVAKSLKKLESDKMISRNTSTDDARQNELTITERGKAIVEESHRIMQSIDTDAASALSDEELDTFCTLIEKIYATLAKMQK